MWGALCDEKHPIGVQCAAAPRTERWRPDRTFVPLDVLVDAALVVAWLVTYEVGALVCGSIPYAERASALLAAEPRTHTIAHTCTSSCAAFVVRGMSPNMSWSTCLPWVERPLPRWTCCS